MISHNSKKSNKTKDENLSFLLDLCRNTTGCANCGVFLVDHDKNSLQPLLTQKGSKSFQQKIKSFWKEKHFPEKLNIKKANLPGKDETIFLAPLLIQDKLVGLFAAYFTAPPELTSDEKYQKLVLFSRQVNSLLENIEFKERVESEQKITETWQKEFYPMKRMASVGALTRDFAHDINNPLQIVLGKAQILTMRMKKEGIDKKYIEEIKSIEKNAQRISCLIKKLSDFAKRGENEVASSSDVNLNHLLERTFLLVKNRFRSKGIDFQIKSQKKIPSVKGNPHQLEQVFLDLFLNAQKSMPKGGVFSVNLKKEKNFLKLDFADTGEKIPEELLPKNSDPLSFTPDLMKRLPAGFLLSSQMVRDHKGKMEVLRNKDKGQVFRLRLPVIS